MAIVRGLLGQNSVSKTIVSRLPLLEGGACRCGLGDVTTQDLQFFEVLPRSRGLGRRYYTFIKAENPQSCRGRQHFETVNELGSPTWGVKDTAG